MGIHRGPNTIKDGLVFGYDTNYGVSDNSTSTRFYKGRPIVNYAQNTVNSYTTYFTYSRSGDIHTCTYNTSSLLALNCGAFSTALTTGDTYTISGYLYLNGAPYKATTPHISTYITNTSSQISRDDGYFSYTQTWGGSGWLIHSLLCGSGLSSGDIITIENMQMEIGAASPFSSTSRSNTGSLIDLKKSTNIDMSNVSFDAKGQPVFDGTDDYLTVPLTGVNLDSACTIEGVLKRTTTPTAWRTFFNIKHASANAPFFEFRSGGNVQHIYADYYNVATEKSTTAAALATGEYGHAISTYDGNGVMKMYFNGELVGTTTGVPAFTMGNNPRLTVGRSYSNDRNTDISAPIVKVYNKVLSPEEVKQNFNNIKNRFNI